MNRDALQWLNAWKNDEARKPLLIRGARQVGKTTLVRQFSEKFDQYIELNLEKKAECDLFRITDNLDQLLSAIYLHKQAPVKKGTTLLFIDEIQESPEAIHMLRFFYEEKPELFIIAAGSLLEFSLRKVPSFPVGRIMYLTIHPMNFREFLAAVHPEALNAFEEVPCPDFAHSTLLRLFHTYSIIGGMPEVVNRYIREKSIASLRPVYQSLWQSYKDDVEKYAQNQTDRNIIRHIIDAAPRENDRIKFEGFGKSNYRSREVGEAFRNLDLARIIRLIYPVTEVELPLLSNYRKRPRLQFLDAGLLTSSLMIQGDMIGIADLNDFFRGKIIQQLIYQEYTSVREDPAFKPQFWVREEKGRDAEVDLVVQHHQFVIPIEIKSGEKGTLRSLHQFIGKANHPYAVRFYPGPLKIDKAQTPAGKPYFLMNLPYFLATRLSEYIDYFLTNFTE